jgi:hydrogenase expression/formation protein HypD
MGSSGYENLHEKYGKPFVITGFEPEHILLSICDLALMLSGEKKSGVYNLYKNAVKDGGNIKAQMAIADCFEAGNAMWRGIGIIENSALYLNERYLDYDAGSFGLDNDKGLPEGCRCKDVIVGRINPTECPMFGEICNPSNPLGACMVAEEGTCGIWYRY